MPTKKNTWSSEKAALKKIQIHFEFQRDIMRSIRHEAAEKDLNPSDIVRQKLGLTYSKIQRPRLGLSFNNEELVILAKRYKLSSTKDSDIKRCVMDELNAYYNKKIDNN